MTNEYELLKIEPNSKPDQWIEFIKEFPDENVPQMLPRTYSKYDSFEGDGPEWLRKQFTIKKLLFTDDIIPRNYGFAPSGQCEDGKYSEVVVYSDIPPQFKNGNYSEADKRIGGISLYKGTYYSPDKCPHCGNINISSKACDNARINIFTCEKCLTHWLDIGDKGKIRWSIHE